MTKVKHTGETIAACPACITRAEREALFGRGYLEQMAIKGKDYEHLHRQARQSRVDITS